MDGVRRFAVLVGGIAVVTGSLTACSGSRATPSRSSSPVVETHTSPPRFVTVALANRARVRIPGHWAHAAFFGAPATIFFPLVFFSSQPITGPCAHTGNDVECDSQNWFPPEETAPTHGVILLWGYSERPGSYHYTWGFVPGRHTIIDHRPAKIWSGAATDSCPTGTSSELDADVRDDAHGYPGEYFTMTACFGRSLAPGVRHDVYAMMDSLRVN